MQNVLIYSSSILNVLCFSKLYFKGKCALSAQSGLRLLVQSVALLARVVSDKAPLWQDGWRGG